MSETATRSPLNGRYRLLERLGKGATGEVFLAEDLSRPDRRLAVKILHPEAGRDGGPGLRDEFEAMTRLRHPNLVQVYDYGTVAGSGTPFLTMEFVAGGSLREAVPVAPGLVIDLLVQICGALDYIHARGILHHDLKPGNLLLTGPLGEPGTRVKLADFGLASPAERGGREIGTPVYMAPERFTGDPVDRRADLYSLGTVLFHLLAGSPPFQPKDPGGLLQAILHRTPTLPASVREQTPAALQAVIQKLLDPRPGHRYPTAAAVVQELNRLGGLSLELDAGEDLVRSADLAGRDDELRILSDWIQEIGPGRSVPRLIVLRGETGIGKSRLLQEARARAQLAGVEVVDGEFSERAGRPFGPWGEILRHLLARLSGGTPEDDTIAQARQDLAPLLAEPVGGSTPAADARRRMLAAIAIVLRAAARRFPLLFCLEDLSAADAADLAILDRVLRAGGDASIRVLATLRDDDAGGRPAIAFLAQRRSPTVLSELPLAPLTEAAIDRMVGSILGVDRPPRPLLESLRKLVGGNPLFAEMRLRQLFEERAIVRAPEGWRVDADLLRRLAVPASASELLKAQVSRLPAGERTALEVLAVAGVALTPGDVARLSPGRSASTHEALLSLESRGLVQRTERGEEPGFSLRTELLVRVVCEECATRRRRSLHRQLAARLEAQGAVGSEELARHHEGAGDRARALEALRQAAGEAARGCAHERAIDLYERALGLEPAPEERGSLESLLAAAHEAMGANRRAIEVLQRSLPTDPAPERESAVQTAIARNASLTGDHLLAEAATKRAIELFERLGDRQGEAEAQRLLGITYGRRNDWEPAQRCFESARAICRELGDLAGEARVLNNLGLLRSFQGDHEGAVELIEQALERRDPRRDRRDRFGTLVNLGYVRNRQGDYAEAVAVLEESIAQGNEVGDRQNVGNVRIHLADSLRCLGQLDAALGSLERALHDHQETADVSRQIECHDKIGELQRVLGDLATAAEHHRRALDLAVEIADPVQAAFARASLALDQLGLGEPGAGEELEAALEASRDRSRRAEARALRGLALVEAMRGRWPAMKDRADRLIVVAEDGNLPEDRAWGLRLLGEAQLGEGALEAGRSTLRQAAAAAAVISRPELEREVLLLLADSFQKGGRPGDALEARQRAQRVLEETAMKIEDEKLRSNFLSRAGRPAAASAERSRQLTAKPEEPAPDRSRGLGAIYEISQAINAILDPDRLLESVMDLAIRKLDADRGLLILFDGPGGEMRARVVRAMEDETIDDALAYSRHVVQQAAEGRPVLSFDAAQDDRFKDFRSVRIHGIRSLLCVPLMLAGEVVGTVYLDSRRAGVAFDEEDLRFLEVFANMAALALHNAREFEGLRRENRALREQVKGRFSYANIVGKSPRMQTMFDIVSKVTGSSLSVLICGESGTGKELVARAIHFNGSRRDKPFFSENCAALNETLLESELFGHVKGAFTGADSSRQGLFELANGGTLFLDEVGDMSLNMQSKLLRAIQEGEIRPVGGKQTVKVDVRMLSATNQDLERLMREGRFREDLFYRLNVVQVTLPPLRDRKEDIPLLVDHFLRRQAEQEETPVKRLDVDALSLILRYEWPGNVRELENEVRKLAVFAEGEVITLDDINRHHDLFHKLTDLEQETAVESIEAVERKQILRALQETAGHRGKAAQLLGISRATIFRKIKLYGISS